MRVGESSDGWVSVATEPLCPGFERLSSQPIVILVGLTAVGKTAVVEWLVENRRWAVLPNRRWIADHLIIP